jgi:hypothetical protein
MTPSPQDELAQMLSEFDVLPTMFTLSDIRLGAETNKAHQITRDEMKHLAYLNQLLLTIKTWQIAGQAPIQVQSAHIAGQSA